MKIRQTLIFLAACIVLHSCARTYQVVPLAHNDPAMASILVYRKSLADINAGVKIYCNDTFIGRVGLYRYIKWTVGPGHYVIKARSSKNAMYSLDVVAGGEYQLIVKKTVGVPTGVKLELAKGPVQTHAIQPPQIKRK